MGLAKANVVLDLLIRKGQETQPSFGLADPPVDDRDTEFEILQCKCFDLLLSGPTWYRSNALEPRRHQTSISLLLCLHLLL